MIRKHFIVALLMLAYSIVLGHSIIPHHHHHKNHVAEQFAMHHDDDEDDDHENSGFAHNFENYFHSTNSGDLHQQPTSKISYSNLSVFYVLSFFEYRVLSFEKEIPPIIHLTDQIPVLLHCLSPKGLRAPPFILA